ncbi:MAG: hypothetical protein ACXWQO_11155 [Bdellovibrionota bacterium]
MNQAPNKKIIFMVSLFLAFFSGLAGGAIFLYRDHFFQEGRMLAEPDLDLSPDETLFAKASDYAERKFRGSDTVCPSHWLGKDSRFIYLAFGCAKFSVQEGQTRAFGDQGFRALRLRHIRGWIFGMDEAGVDHLGQNLRRLYPPQVEQLWWKISTAEEFLRAGKQITPGLVL